MSKILFIQPHKIVLSSDLNKGNNINFLSERTDKFVRVSPSLPAMTILGALRNHESYFIDATADNPKNIYSLNDCICAIGMSDTELYDKISDIKPDLILLTSMFTSEYLTVNHISGLIKNKFKLPIVVGGHHASLRPRWHLDKGNVDFIALGEGELNINDIIDGIEGKIPLSKIRGLVYKDKSGKLINQSKDKILHDLNQRWDIETVVKNEKGYRYPLSLTTRNPELYIPKVTLNGTGILYASRGCPYSCEYCNATSRDGSKIRHMSLENMIKLTEEFISLGANTFHNESDTFGMHPVDREYIEWVSKQREKGREINLVNTNGFFANIFFFSGKFMPERVDLLKKAGFKTISFAIDSFNPKFNRGKLNKINLQMLDDCFGYIKQQGLNLDVYMMYLFPEQTEEELKSDVKNIQKLSKNITTTTWRSLTYFPGTAYYDWAIKNRKFTEESYKKMIQKGHSFYHFDNRFNFSNIRNPPSLI